MRIPVGFKQVEEFNRGKWYVVIKEYDWTPTIPFFRAEKVFCYRLQVGQRLKFKGPNFAGPEFLAEDGRKVIFPTPAMAFRVVGEKAA